MPPSPPRAPRRSHVHREHGIERADPWYWLRDRDDPAVLAHLEAENAWTRQRTSHTGELRQTLYEEMLGRIHETDSSVPAPWGDWAYTTRTVEGLPYPIHCRRPRGGGEEVVLLDINARAEGHDFTHVGRVTVSPDQRLVAWTEDHSGRERYRVHVRRADTGEDVPVGIEGVGRHVVWAADGRSLACIELDDDTLRPCRVRLHRPLEGGPGRLLFEETDPRFNLWVHRTFSDRYLVLTSSSSTTSEQHVLDASDPERPLRCVSPRHAGMRYHITHTGDRFFIVTDHSDDADGNHVRDCVDQKLMVAPETATSLESWEELIPHRDAVHLINCQAWSRHLLIAEREDGLVHLRIWRLADGSSHRVAMPEPAWAMLAATNLDFEASRVHIRYSSPVTPPTTVSYGLEDRSWDVLKVDEVRGGHDPGQYEVVRLEARAPDGVRVPVTLTRPRSDGPVPVILDAYGSYGVPNDPGFDRDALSLLQRGVGVAIAHVRGGGDRGRTWYEAGKLEHKMNTFTDVIACAEHLVACGQADRSRLALRGGSAGGLLVGAVINQRPDLFRVAVALVPFVDVLTTMLDESLPLTAGEWEEWGDPRDRAVYDRIAAYSPYDNVVDQPYPHLLVTAGLNDPRVQYWEPAKWVARLRATVSDPRELLLRTQVGAGHQGPSGRYGYLEERAFAYAFVLDKLGAVPSPP